VTSGLLSSILSQNSETQSGINEKNIVTIRKSALEDPRLSAGWD
jgi:hypothetical protein